MKIVLMLILLTSAMYSQSRGIESRTFPTYSRVSRECFAYRTTGMNLTQDAENLVTFETVDSANTGFITPNVLLYHAGRWLCEISVHFKNSNIVASAIAGLKLRLNGVTVAQSRIVWETPATETQYITASFPIDVSSSDTTDNGRAAIRLYVLTNLENTTLTADSSAYPVTMFLKFDNPK